MSKPIRRDAAATDTGSERPDPPHTGGPTVAPEPDLSRALGGVTLPVPLRGIPAEAAGERVPNELFDQRFYTLLYGDVDGSPRAHFAKTGRAEGRAPSVGAIYLAPAIRLAAQGSATPMADLVDLLPPDRRQRAGTRSVWERLWRCVHPDAYAAQLQGSERARIEDLCADGLSRTDATVAHFLAVGARSGLRVGALFNEDWYLARLEEHGLEVPDGTLPFFHWLTKGWSRRIVPTPLFDEDFYLDRHPSVAKASTWGFRHYLERGCYNANSMASPTGRDHDGAADPEAAASRRPLLLTQWLHHSDRYDLTRTSWLEEGQTAVLARYERFRNSPRVAELTAKIAAIEPLVYVPRQTNQTVSLAPYRQNRVHLYSRAEDLRRALNSAAHDAVVLVPGDDVRCAGIAAAVTRELQARTPGVSVLTAATDTSPADPSDPSDPSDLAFDFHRFTDGMTSGLQVDLLLDMVRGVEARTVITVASRLGWQLFRAYVRQLAAGAALGGVIPAGSEPENEIEISRILEGCFGRLDWLMVWEETQRTGIADRFVLPRERRQRLLAVDAAAPEAAVGRALDLPRRSA